MIFLAQGSRTTSVIRTVSCCFMCSGLHARYTDAFQWVLTVSLSGVGGVSLYVLDSLSLFVTLDTDPWWYNG